MVVYRLQHLEVQRLYLFMGRCFCPDYIYSDWLSAWGLYGNSNRCEWMYVYNDTSGYDYRANRINSKCDQGPGWTCNGDADGSTDRCSIWGTAGYTYLWDDASAQTTSTATGLAPGDYTVTVTDANGCTFTTTPAVTITEPILLTASATKVQDVQCNGDAEMVVSGYSIWGQQRVILIYGTMLLPRLHLQRLA